MKRFLVLALTPLALLAGAHAATATDSGVTTSTDPAKAAAVERHAQELAARDAQPAVEAKTAKTQKAATKTAHNTTHKTAHKTAHETAHKTSTAKHHAKTTTSSTTASK